MKRIIAAALLSSLFATGAFAQQAAQATSAPVEQYHYGMKLDVAKVLSKTGTHGVNGANPATLVYQDHQGNVHQVQYLETTHQNNVNG